MQTQSGYSQADTREFMVYTDQHGREWEGWGDVKAKLHPTSPLRLLVDAPWIPPQSSMRFSQRKPGEFVIEYDALIAEHRRAEQARADLTLEVATHYNVPNFDPDDPEAFTAQMKRELGKGPLPIEPLLAARAGNGYVLGLRPFDEKRPGDVRLKAALEVWNARTKVNMDGGEFADEEFAEPELVPARRRGRKAEEEE